MLTCLSIVSLCWLDSFSRRYLSRLQVHLSNDFGKLCSRHPRNTRDCELLGKQLSMNEDYWVQWRLLYTIWPLFGCESVLHPEPEKLFHMKYGFYSIPIAGVY